MSIDDLARLIAEPAIEFRPELRWWLAEGLHTNELFGGEGTQQTEPHPHGLLGPVRLLREAP